MIGSAIMELDRVDSTNSYAVRLLASDDLEDGTVIWAHDQYAGRGQQQHSWLTKPGKNLTLTIVLKPWFLSPDRQFQLNKTLTLGVIDFIRKSLGMPVTYDADCLPILPGKTDTKSRNEYLTNHCTMQQMDHAQSVELEQKASGPVTQEQDALKIKWPNDIYLGRKKAGGILIENRVMGDRLEYALAGIGLNINQTTFGQNLPDAVSMIHHLRHRMKLREALQSLLRAIDFRYRTLALEDSPSPDDEYNRNLLGFGQWRSFMKGGARFEGRITGVDQYGRLGIETRDGNNLFFNHKEVEYILE